MYWVAGAGMAAGLWTVLAIAIVAVTLLLSLVVALRGTAPGQRPAILLAMASLIAAARVKRSSKRPRT